MLSSHTLSQDKAEVLADVRGIIAEQLGTELDKVRGRSRGGIFAHNERCTFYR